MTTVRIGILSQDEMRQRVLAIAKGDLKPGKNDPKIWFTSIKSLAQVLSEDNRALLSLIRESKPVSVSALAIIAGRNQSNVSRTLKTMAQYGLVQMQRDGQGSRPIAIGDRYEISV